MNCLKFRSVIASKKTLFQLFILGITISMFFTSCGGGSVPEYLREARVDVSIWTPKKEVVLEKEGLNLAKAIVPLKDSTEFMIVSGRQFWEFN